MAVKGVKVVVDKPVEAIETLVVPVPKPVDKSLEAESRNVNLEWVVWYYGADGELCKSGSYPTKGEAMRLVGALGNVVYAVTEAMQTRIRRGEGL